MYLQKGLHSQRRRGNTLILTCLSMTAIVFLSALAVDSGNQMAERRHAQNVNDAAALAGCIKLAKLRAAGTTPTAADISSAVTAATATNGYTNGTNCTVTVNYPPTSGDFVNDTNSVEVKITFTYNNFTVAGSNSVTVRSVASCNTGGAPTVPMLILDPSASKSFLVTSGAMTLSNASTVVNSTATNAAVVEGNVNSAATMSVRTVGGSAGSFSPATKTTGTPSNDPYALMPVPSSSGMTTRSSSGSSSGGTVTFNPGYYPNGLYASSGNVVLNPGVYLIKNGNFWINTPGTVTGNGVTIIHDGSNSTAQLKQNYNLNCGIVLCPTNGDYTITPPTTGPYAGVSLFQTANCTGDAFYDFWGTGDLNVGLQYFPNSTLRCWAKGTGTINCNELVTNKFKLTGTHEIYGNSQNGGFSRLNWNATRATNRPPTFVYLAE